MRVAPQRRRRWNNILILAVIVFIGVLNLPSVIKTYLIEPEASTYPTLLNPHARLQAIHFDRLSLELSQGRWHATPPTDIAAEELVKRWQALMGTEIDDSTYQSLQSSLRTAQTIEVWYSDQEEPQRITYYRTPQFWLFKNWQDKWIAISVEEHYLLPSL